MLKFFLPLIIIALSTGICKGQEAKGPKSLYRELTEISSVITGLTFSTDGLKLAFTNMGDIYSIPLNGSEPMQVTTSDYREDQPQWSPDATKLTYRKDSSNLTGIWIYNTINKKHSRITAIKENAFSPSWAPNGKAVAYSTDSYGSVDVMIMEFESGKERRLTAAKGNEYIFGFHPNGKFVGYYERNTTEEDIYAIALTGKEEFPITRSQIPELDPKWSYDGTRVLFHIQKAGIKEIFTADFPYGELNKIGQFESENILPIISTNAKRVIYPKSNGDKVDLILYTIKAEEDIPLGLAEIENLGQPVWSLGGRILALSAYDESVDKTKIWLVNISQFLRGR